MKVRHILICLYWKDERRGMMEKPNVVFLFGNQWRAQAVGYAGDENVHTPNIDQISEESIRFTNAISG